jgi:quercetin dioxygenase-like cupin family protein
MFQLDNPQISRNGYTWELIMYGTPLNPARLSWRSNMRKPTWSQFLAYALCALTLTQASLALAQVPSLSSKPLLKAPLSGFDTREVTIVSAELAPGAVLPRHTHPGDEYATVLEGVVEIRAAGQEPRRFTVGQSYHNPKDVPHEARNAGGGIARLIVTFVLEKNLPFSSPAPAQ